jgi:DNA-binding response OmpR family regulator
MWTDTTTFIDRHSTAPCRGWKCRVLIVDGDEIVRTHLRRLLKNAYFDVQVARSGEEALHVMGALHFHILLTALQLPDMSGLELCRKVRSDFADGYIHIVALSARGTRIDTLLSRTCGADAHIVKGSEDEEILVRMEIARSIAYSNFVSRSPRLVSPAPVLSAYECLRENRDCLARLVAVIDEDQ